MNKELQFLMYNTPQEEVKIDVVVKDETVWLTQKAMAMLFDVQVPAISKHLKNIFQEGELDERMVVSKMEITTQNWRTFKNPHIHPCTTPFVYNVHSFRCRQ